MDDARQRTILIVDDNKQNLKLAVIVLEKAGFRLLTASDAEEALRSLESEEPDLILMDIQLPGMDGLELTRVIRKDPRFELTPIVALSAYAMNADREKAKQAGCTGYITKPLEVRTFARDVQAYLPSADRPKPQAPAGPRLPLDPVEAIRREFITESAQRLKAGRGDAAAMKTLLHQIAGTGGTFGLYPMSRLAREAEELLLDGGMGSAEFERVVDGLGQIMEAPGGIREERVPDEVLRKIRNLRIAMVEIPMYLSLDAETAVAAAGGRSYLLPAASEPEDVMPYDVLVVAGLGEDDRELPALRKLLKMGKTLLLSIPQKNLRQFALKGPQGETDLLIEPWTARELLVRIVLRHFFSTPTGQPEMMVIQPGGEAAVLTEGANRPVDYVVSPYGPLEFRTRQERLRHL